MKFEKIKPHRVYQDVLSQIKNLMLEGKLKPGDRLMGEREMASALGVSRTTLREALRILELLGLVEIRPGEGTFIEDHNVKQIIAPLALALSVEPNSFSELWETRVALEVEAAGFAALRANEENLHYMDSALKEMSKHFPDVNLFVKADMRLHYMIAQASQNSMLTRLLQTFAEHICQMMQQAGHLRFLHDRCGIRTINEHVRILEAIKSRDVGRARRFMKEHLEGVWGEFQQVSKGNG